MSLFNTSYLMGNDTAGGWGPRYFFTFYSEFGDEQAESAVEVTVFMVIFAASVVANVSIAWAVLRYREMRTVTNCFLLNLTVADLLFAVTTPALAYVRVRPDWPFGDFVCRLLPYSQVVMSPRTPILEQLSGKCKDVKFKVFLTLSLFIGVARGGAEGAVALPEILRKLKNYISGL
ncbi:hypothetical protein AGLY_003736 [Aphis glycines]|uniref:G-protein coupled receptors family 1 profile domain-containing protein n=1 Tax=Aphis glycines TaxID=307491 RepID=A0A6G0TZG3_APHGL|nr:hypothetical protein AGLY_003736 [Aphis glycines]